LYAGLPAVRSHPAQSSLELYSAAILPRLADGPRTVQELDVPVYPSKLKYLKTKLCQRCWREVSTAEKVAQGTKDCKGQPSPLKGTGRQAGEVLLQVPCPLWGQPRRQTARPETARDRGL
jgi:hypothetical protein